MPGTDNGVHTFTAGVTLKTAGIQTVTVSDTSNGLVLGASGTVTVTPATATHFVISAPASAKKGAPYSFTVTALDAYGNVATGYRGTVTFSSSDSKAKFSPTTYTFTAADAGLHTFTNGATFNTVGTWSLTVSDKKNGLSGTDLSISVS